MEDLREALRRDQADPGALRLEHRVRRHRRPVQDVAEVADRDARLLADPAHADEHALRGIRRGGRRLHTVLRAGTVVPDQEEVGERPPHVDSEPECHPLLRPQ